MNSKIASSNLVNNDFNSLLFGKDSDRKSKKSFKASSRAVAALSAKQPFFAFLSIESTIENIFSRIS